jgi:hypothetical protein
MNVFLLYQITLLQDGIRLETYLLSCLVFPGLLRRLDGSASQGCSTSEHDCLLLAEVHSASLGHWCLATVELPSSDNASPNGLALHNGNILCLLLALGLLYYSGWLLGQSYEVPADSTSGTDFLLADYSSGAATDAEGTTSRTTAEAGTDSAADCNTQVLLRVFTQAYTSEPIITCGLI